MSRRLIGSLTALLVLAACEHALPTPPGAPGARGGDPAPETPTGPPSTPVEPSRVQLMLSGDLPVVGMRWQVFVNSNVDPVEIDVADPAVAVLEAPTNVFAKATLRLVGPGQTTVYARAGGVVSSAVVRVIPEPPPTTALVVDSFTVVEYRQPCAWQCPYLMYAPLLWLREPTGSATAEIVGVQFGVPSLLAGAAHQEHGSVCEGSFSPGQSAQVIRFEPYPWNDILLFASLEGKPIPQGRATARVLVRDASGQLGMLKATGSIHRNVADPKLPWIAEGGRDLIPCVGPS